MVHGIGGVVEAYLLPDVMLIFEFNQSAFVEYPDEILVLGQTSANGTKKEEAMEIPSLLGVDILKDYAIKFRNQKIILER
ncbi:MAG: hypothetical protein M1526_03665 [Candidatus Thermoplasmatota archaeon]|nr:hypothetical protein [Candidatus Thermoplasmatota archaeon]